MGRPLKTDLESCVEDKQELVLYEGKFNATTVCLSWYNEGTATVRSYKASSEGGPWARTGKIHLELDELEKICSWIKCFVAANKEIQDKHKVKSVRSPRTETRKLFDARRER